MQRLNPTLKYITFSFLAFVCFAVIMPTSGHPWDNFCWSEWSKYIYNNGLGHVFYSRTDYFPLYHYILKIYSLMQGSPDETWANVRYLKLFTLVFHFVTGYFVYRITKFKNENSDTTLVNTFYYLINVAVLYNVIIWGQVDIILACLVFISVYYAVQHQSILSLVFLLLALNFKLHAIVFVPVIGLLLLPRMISYFSVKKLFIGSIVLVVLQFLILLPFIIDGSVKNLPRIITGSVDKFAVISAYAFNIWYLLLSGDLFNTSDTTIVFGLSYKNWGLVFFLISSTAALWPLLKTVYTWFAKKSLHDLALDKIILISALIPLLFFYFNTQMHERYSHPALVFLITYSLISSKPLLSIIASVAYFLNLEAELQFLKLPNYGTVIFDPRFISGLYLLTIIGIFLHLYEINLQPTAKKTQLSH
ncbi:hypothetical protein [Aurantibacillus circumpalustris]|uniref:hypothetical protein n=1 Tax=Aurantibacillus circumpalustris TaxID=3036359 RepID=UPI00295A973B|nr:hypothetical protein [Aurantibacillus circumpalustris]